MSKLMMRSMLRISESHSRGDEKDS